MKKPLPLSSVLFPAPVHNNVVAEQRAQLDEANRLLVEVRGQLTTANATIATRDASIATLTSDLATANATITTVTGERDTARAELATANTALGVAQTEVTRLTGEATTITTKANRLLQSLGHEPLAMTGDVDTGGAAAATVDNESPAGLIAQYTKLTGKARADFYAKNSAKMFPSKKGSK